MLGSVNDAEDVVQDTWLRWQASDRDAVSNVKAYLTRIANNLCLDRMKSAGAQRETYVGSWLPEPIVEAAALYQSPPDVSTELAEDLSYALMLSLERLSPAERAAFILHDVFDYSFEEIAEVLDRGTAACRQLASRARKAIKSDKPRYPVDADASKALAMAFADTVNDGDIDKLTELLAADATFISDGGGRVAAVPKPLVGAMKIAKAIIGFKNLYRGENELTSRYAVINGLSGFVITNRNHEIVQTIILEPNDKGEIQTLYIQRNPEKLTHVAH
jgi:RNA polymerase sigma-70 factor (ECF subfamily)